MGNSRASKCGTDNRYGSHAFFFEPYNAKEGSPAARVIVMTYTLTFVYNGVAYEGEKDVTEPCTTKEQWENAAEGVLLSIIEDNGLPRRGTYYNVCLIDPANGKMVWNEEVYTPISKKVD
mgnify:CR=1 FL=1